MKRNDTEQSTYAKRGDNEKNKSRLYKIVLLLLLLPIIIIIKIPR